MSDWTFIVNALAASADQATLNQQIQAGGGNLRQPPTPELDEAISSTMQQKNGVHVFGRPDGGPRLIYAMSNSWTWRVLGVLDDAKGDRVLFHKANGVDGTDFYVGEEVTSAVRAVAANLTPQDSRYPQDFKWFEEVVRSVG